MAYTSEAEFQELAKKVSSKEEAMELAVKILTGAMEEYALEHLKKIHRRGLQMGTSEHLDTVKKAIENSRLAAIGDWATNFIATTK